MSICRILKHVILKNQKLIKSIELNTIQKYGQRMNKMSLVYWSIVIINSCEDPYYVSEIILKY